MDMTVVEQLINQQGIRIERVAVALDLSVQGVQWLVGQKTSPRVSHVKRLCELLDVPMEEIIGEDYCWRRVEQGKSTISETQQAK